MNQEQFDEWRALRAEQDALRGQLEQMERRLARFERTQAAVEPSPPVMAAVPPTMAAVVMPPLPVAARNAGVPPPLPPMAPVPTPPRESMEARIGSEWLVRVGVVVLLTALAFGASLLYQNVIPYLGPAAKVGLLYLGAGILAGLGAWLERSRAAQENPKVRNYARVVLAGGMAAVYYVTYAAHYYPNLRVIDSQFVAGVLLIGWTAFMVWLADRRGSQTLATFAILLAFYASAINEIAGFTLASNLPLTVAAVFLLRRHLWKIFPFASLLATYGSYGYWRFFHVYSTWRGFNDGSHRPLDTGGFGIEVAFLLVYWLLFTWAVFSTSERTLPAVRRAGFASLNNAAFFLLVTWSVVENYPGAFWKWALGFGVVLLALAETCRRLPQRLDRETESAFLLEGVLLVTVGFYAYFVGWQLCIALAVQSVALLAAAGRRDNRWLLWASVVTGALAFAAAMPDTSVPDTGQFRWLAPAVAAAMAFNAWQSQRLRGGILPRSLAVAGGIYEGLTMVLCLIWGGKYFPHEAKFSLFCLAGSLVFALGVETRHRRLLLWSYVPTCVGLLVFWLGYDIQDHRHPLQLIGIACLVAQQQYGRRRLQVDPLTTPRFPLKAQGALITAAVSSAWLMWTITVVHWRGNGIMLAASWSLFAAVVFIAGLALRERVYRWLALLGLVGTLGHVVLLDVWELNSLERFLSLLSLGIVLLAIGFFYTRYQSRLRDLF